MKRNAYEGKVFGRLTVIRCVGKDKFNNALWECLCECGKTSITSSLCLGSGHTRSCGCLKLELAGSKQRTHGKSRAAEYNTWMHIKQRCTNPKNRAYNDYGGRGIMICPEWVNNFSAFYDHVGPKPTASHTIERINNSGNYEPGNVRWATRAEQNRNTRANRFLTLNGETHHLCEWARRLGIHWITLAERIDRCGWSVEKALSTPKKSSRLV